MALSKRVLGIEESVTMAVSAKAKAMRAEGIDVVSMDAGEPDFDTPQYIKDGAIKAIEDGFTKYTQATGIPELKRAICDKLERDNGLKYDPTQVVVNCGAKHTIFDAAMSLINEGDEAIIPAPYWVSYVDQVKLMGGKAVVVETRPENGLKMTPDELRGVISSRTKVLILNSPSNPHGAVYSEDELSGLAEVLADSEVYVISDEIYEKIIYGVPFFSIAQMGEAMKARTILVNGVSKAYAMTGWRIGYAAGPKEVISLMAKLESQETSNPSSISQAAALTALNGPQGSVEQMRGAFEERRDYIVDRLNGISGISCMKPDGAFYVFPNMSEVYGSHYGDWKVESSLDLCNFLLKEMGVSCVPGSGFGMDGHMRVSYATSMENIRKALDRIEEGVGRLSG